MPEREREAEEEEEGGASDTAPMLPGRPPSRHAAASVGLGRPGGASPGPRPRGLLAGLLLRLLLPGAVFLLALLPAAAVVYVGFLCHSRVHPAPSPRCRPLLSDRGSAALIVLGFLSLPPLLVLASAARARLARRLCARLPPLAWAPGLRRPPGPGDRGPTEEEEEEERLCAHV
ncbi:transmembrane protein 88B [Thomomys bottae]